MQPDLAAGIVRILHADGSTAGTGFVVSARGLIATCSHVVQSEQSQRDGEPRPERVSVVFHATGEQRDAIVEPAWWRPHDSDDVAILRLDGPLPAGVVPIRLGFTRHCNGHKLQTLGFPELPGGYETAWAEGEIRGVVPHPGKRPMLQLDAKPIRQGMSGAPVLDLNTKRVIGMVSEYAPSAPLEWATTSETLKEVCPELELHLPQAVEDYLTALGQFCRDLPYVSLERDVPLTTVYVRQQMRRKPDEKRQPDDERAQLEALERRARPMPIEEALAQHARLLVVGGPGAGKSTLLRHLVEEQLVEEDDARDGARFTLRSPTAHLTILVSLRGLAGREGDATTCLRQQIEAELGKRLPARLPDDFLKEWAEQTGAAWLIALDGLDEILDADRRRALLKELAQTAWPPGSRIVLTSRPDESLSTGGAVTPFDLLPFEPAQVEAFAHNWFKDEALVDAFLRNVQHPTLRAVTSIPLLLTVAAIVFEDEAKKQTATDVGVLAPESHRGLADIRRVTLYERFVTILLKEDRTANRRMKEQFCEQFRTDLGETLFDYRREALECVALAMQEARYVEAALIEFLGRLPRWSDADARRKAGDVLNILVQQRTGLVVQRGTTYDFIHPSFREYLAAAAIVRACENDRECVWQRAISHWQNERWREVPLLALGILSEEGTDVTHLLERIPWRREQGALYFVGAALSEKVQVSPNFADGVIGSLLDAARRMDWLDRRQRPNALTVLAELRAYPLAGDGLLSLARDERVDADIRQATAEALGTLGRADDLLALARDERVDAGVRTAAAESLGKLGRADEAAPI
ncbi:MAG TPA: trypsin-like peptidase domain-containing protein, partial [Anaerolineae bacterium]|nr:trypsin-like peptidase domain-containing protein [Anaerolineae bacterium]